MPFIEEKDTVEAPAGTPTTGRFISFEDTVEAPTPVPGVAPVPAPTFAQAPAERIPELRAAPPEEFSLHGAWNGMLRLFEDPQKESAKAVQALVDAESIGIPPSAAFRLQDTIDRGIDINPKAAMKRSTLGERVNQSWDTGGKQNQVGELGYNVVLRGDMASFEMAQKIEATIPGPEGVFISESRLEDAVRSAATLLPMTVDIAEEAGWKGAVLGTGFGLIAMAAGQPEAVAPMAMAGLTIGGAEGIFEGALRKESGLAFMELMKFEDAEGNKLDINLARGAAFGIGAINAGLEVAEIKVLLRAIPGGDKLLREAISKAVTNPDLKRRLFDLTTLFAGTVSKETGIEVAQESTNIVFGEIAKEVNNSLEGTDIDPASAQEIVERLHATAVEAAQGFAVIAAPGVVAKGVIAEARARTPEEIAAREEQVATITEDITATLTEAGIDEETARTEAERFAEAVAARPEPEIVVPPEIPEVAAEEALPPTPEVEALTIETDAAADRALAELIGEGREAGSLTEEEIAERAETFAQAPLRPGEVPVAPAPPGEAVRPVVAPTEAEVAISDAVSSQLEAAGVEKTDAAAQAQLYQAFFGTMGRRAGVDPGALFQRYNLSVAREVVPVAPRVVVNPDKSLNLTPSQRTSLTAVRTEVEAGEAGRRIFVQTGEEVGPGQVRVVGEPSTFPEFFKGKRYTKKDTLKAIDKTLEGKPLTVKQLEIVQDLNESFRQEASEKLRQERAREVPGVPPVEEGIFFTEDAELAVREPEKFTTDPNDPRILFQREGELPRGRITFRPEKVDIELLEDADMSTFLHETGHLYLKVFSDLARQETTPVEIKADYKVVMDWLGVKRGQIVSIKQNEKFARGFEAFLRDGKAPSAELRSAFARFREWLVDIYRNLRDLNVKLTPEVTNIMEGMLAEREDIRVEAAARGITTEVLEGIEGVLPQRAVKRQVARATGVKKIVRMIREDKALNAAFKKAEQSARKAFKAGKAEAIAEAQAEMREVIGQIKANAAEKIAKIKTEKQKANARRRKIRNIIDFLGLSESEIANVTKKKNIQLMTDWEFKQFADNLLIKATQVKEKNFEKARLMETIQRKNLQKWENYRRALNLPPVSRMTLGQIATFADIMEEYHDSDIFLTQRELETVDRTDLKGVRTWREAKERLSKETGIPVEEFDTVKVDWTDKFKWDTALAESNPFYELMVTETNKKLLNAEARAHTVENEVFALAKKSAKSRKLKITERLIPQDEQIMDYLEATPELKPDIAENMTAEQLDLAHYMQEYFSVALDYLVKTNSLDKGRENYFVHMRRTFLETLKDDGLLNAISTLFKNYQEDRAIFNIIDDDTGKILPLEKFFQFSLRRTGTLTPTKNVVRAFLTYANTFEKKVSLDELIPKLDIYAQSLTPKNYTPRGLEMDRSIKKFVYQFVNNKKGRRIDMGFVKQGDKIDLTIRGLRTFISMLDLGLSIPVGVASFVGERAANFTLLGEKGYLLGSQRVRTKKGKAILEKYESFVGRSVWEEFTAPGKEVTERVVEGMFGLFRQATISANKQFLLASLTKKEYDSGTISDERLATLRIEMGRFRAVPGSKSLVGSTAAGGGFIQYKTWAVPIARTVIKDLNILARDLRNKPPGEAITSREARELFRAARLSAVILIVWGIGDEDDRSFVGQLSYKIRREALTVLQAISPDLWAGYPRMLSFIYQLSRNLTSLVKLEEYKTKPGLKGVGGLKRQLTPGAIRPLLRKEEKRQRIQLQ